MFSPSKQSGWRELPLSSLDNPVMIWVLWRLQVQDSKVEKNTSNPVAVALALDCTFDAVMTSFGMVQRLSTQIRHDVSEALSISPDKVAVLCYQKEMMAPLSKERFTFRFPQRAFMNRSTCAMYICSSHRLQHRQACAFIHLLSACCLLRLTV